MLALLFLLTTGIDNKLFEYFDKLHVEQLEEARATIAKIQKKPALSLNLDAAKAKLANITKNYAIEIPELEFSKGVKVGDYGTIGFTHVRSGSLQTGTGGSVATYTKSARRVKVLKVDKGQFSASIQGLGEVVVRGVNDDTIVDEKVIALTKHIFRYDGKDGNTKIFSLVGTADDLTAWKKAKSGKK